MPTIAVTGATGFVGRHLAATLRESGWHVRALVRRDDPQLAELGCSLIRGDLADELALEMLVDGATAVVHAAGVVRAADVATFFTVNAHGSGRIAAAASRQPGCRLLQVSSLAARASAVSPYAASKAEGEAEALGLADRLQVVVVRPPAVYGPGGQSDIAAAPRTEPRLARSPAQSWWPVLPDLRQGSGPPPMRIACRSAT